MTVYLGGGFLAASPIAFTSDNKHLLSCCGNAVKLFDTTTGSCVGVLPSTSSDPTSASTNLTGLLLLPNDLVVACDAAGHVRTWDLQHPKEARLVIKLDKGLQKMFALGSSDDAVLCLTQGDKRGNAKVMQVSLKPGKSAFPVLKIHADTALAVSSSGGLVAYASGKHITVWNRKSDPSRKALLSGEVEHQISSLAFSHDALLIGFQTGAIQVIREASACLADTKTFSSALCNQRAYLHWHSDAVLAFGPSPVDSYLLSGGREGVGVLWNLATGKYQFLPRLGGSIMTASVSQDGSRYALTTSHNAILIASSASFKVICEIRGLALAQQPTSLQPHPPAVPVLLRHPLDDGLVLVGSANGAALQTFDPRRDKHVGSLDIVRQNIINQLPEERQKNLLPSYSRISLAAVSNPAGWLATFESNFASSSPSSGGDCKASSSSGVLKESCLKFWRLDTITGDYQMIGLFDSPHGKYRVNQIAFRPKPVNSDELVELVSVGEDGQRLHWSCSVDSGSSPDITIYTWSVTGRHRYYPRTMAPVAFQSISFSPDSSLMAVTMGNSVLIYDADEPWKLLYRLTASKAVLKDAQFIGNTGGLVAYDQAGHLTVWDLETGKVRWELAGLQLTALTAHGNRFAISVATKENSTASGHNVCILEFGPAKPIPLQLCRLVSQPVVGLAYIGKQRGKGMSLLALTANHYFLDAFGSENSTQPNLSLESLSSAPKPSILNPLAQLILENQPEADRSASKPAAIHKLTPLASSARPQDLLLTNTPSHALPPMRLLFASFIRLKLASK